MSGQKDADTKVIAANDLRHAAKLCIVEAHAAQFLGDLKAKSSRLSKLTQLLKESICQYLVKVVSFINHIKLFLQ